MVTCSRCSTPMEETLHFCPSCGQQSPVFQAQGLLQTQYPYGHGVSSPPPPEYLVPKVPQASSVKRSGWKITTIALVLLLIAVSGLLAVTYTNSHGIIATLQVRATQQSTNDALAITHLSSTATATAQTNATMQNDPYTHSGTLAFVDSLSKPEHWDSYAAPDGTTVCTFKSDGLHVSEQTANQYSDCIGEGTEFQSFVIQTNMTILSGTCGGFILQRNESGDGFYWIGLCQNGKLGFYLYKKGQFKTILTKAVSTFHAGEKNVVGIVDQSGTFDFYVNRQKVGSATDTTYAIGEQALMAVDKTDVVYSDVAMWTLK